MKLAGSAKDRMNAFEHFGDGHDDAAVHTALPRVEDLLREIERDRNVPVLSVAQGNAPGGMRSQSGHWGNWRGAWTVQRSRRHWPASRAPPIPASTGPTPRP